MMLLFVESEVILLLDTFLFGFFKFLNKFAIISQYGINSLRLKSVSHPLNAPKVLHFIIFRLLPSAHYLMFWLFLSGGRCGTTVMGVFPEELFESPDISRDLIGIV